MYLLAVVMEMKIDIDELMGIISDDMPYRENGECDCPSPFSSDNIAIVINPGDDLVGDWSEEMSSIDVDSLIDGDWSVSEPDDGDYGSIVLESDGDHNFVTDDFDLGDKGRHRFKKKF